MIRIESLLTALCLAAGAPAAAAQFSLFTWTLDNPGNGIANVSPTSMGIFGTPWQVAGSVIKYTAVSGVAGRVTVQSSVWPEDGFCGGGGSLALLYGDDGGGAAYATCTWNGTLTSMVWEGSSFGYGLQTLDTSWPYSVTLTGLEFTPTWTNLGGVLAGDAGAPLLRGTGALLSGHTIGIHVVGAAPSAPAALVIGLQPLGAPFMGGVMVPSVDLLVMGLSTGPTGTLSLSAPWPTGVPLGFELLVQAWVVDASGPEGYTASNGLRGVVL